MGRKLSEIDISQATPDQIARAKAIWADDRYREWYQKYLPNPSLEKTIASIMDYDEAMAARKSSRDDPADAHIASGISPS